MGIKEALEREVTRLERVRIKSFEAAEKEGDICLGSWFRRDVERMSDSYKRILKDLEKE